MLDKLLFVSFTLQLAQATRVVEKTKVDPTPCDAADPGATNCDAGNCDVTINSKTYCSKCKSGYVPVNGACTLQAQATMCTPGSGGAEGTCTACTNTQGLYMGGCYDDCPYGDGVAPNTCADAPAGCNIPNCKSCPDGTCTECNDGFVLGNGNKCVASSVNKSGGLSTGAIAGISVAVVIVVGGLVGFLCWWFLCRGKA
ncbi:VSP [Giardia lamblia P15]|uniref:VSP n=1 Tax=Giardia intestinalis (strain P15) TaxID=658858 RepID=E1F8Y1_GIAIA|nr:VSP [Giardia lamblia P15]